MFKRYVLYFFLIYFISCVFVHGISILVYDMALREETIKIKATQEVYTRNQKEVVGHVFEEIYSDLLFLSDQYLMKSFLSTGNPEDRNLLNREYCTFGVRKKRYDQIRLLGINGKEVIRVNFKESHAVHLSEDKLQDKSKRYYFKNTLNSDGIYTSPMDLNIEHKKIEIPFKPVMRFGVVVKDLKEKKKGILIFNYLGKKLFYKLTHGSDISTGNLMIINPEGYWLYGPEKEKLWGFMIKKRSHYTFKNEFPKMWSTIKAGGNGQIQTDKGIFTWETHSLENHENWFWKIISHVPSRKILISVEYLKKKLFLYNIFIMILLAFPVFVFIRSSYKRKRITKELVWSANYDALTGIPNRSMFFSILHRTITHAERYGEKFAVMFIDIDGFKMVNDTFGHDTGDKLLIETAKRLKKCIRESDLVARLGGDEFIVLLNKISVPSDAENVAIKFADILSKSFLISHHTIKISASLGISIYPDNGKTSDILVKKADNEMYKCKREGKNTFSLCKLGDADCFVDK